MRPSRVSFVVLLSFASLVVAVASMVSFAQADRPLGAVAAPAVDPSADAEQRRVEAEARAEQEQRARLAREAAIRAKVSPAGLSWPHLEMITSHFGQRRSGFHHGMDLLCSKSGGEPIYAAHSGHVITAGTLPIYGRAVILQQGATKTLYAHMWRLNVRQGQSVRRGDVLGYCGSTGRSTNPHLHFEVYRNGEPVNPLPQLPSWR